MPKVRFGWRKIIAEKTNGYLKLLALTTHEYHQGNYSYAAHYE